MSEENIDVVENIKQSSTWLRILFMLGFCIALYVVGVVVFVLTLTQALFSVLSGSDNRNLRLLGSSLAAYASQVLNFLTYNTETRPFPFAPFPDAVEKVEVAEPVKKKEAKPTAKKKAAAKKKPAAKKKAAASKTAASKKTSNDKAD